jgi:hypothetical protein
MLRQVLVPSKENSVVALPMEWYGREVEVIVFPLETHQKSKTEKKLPHYIGIDMSGFKFDREEANAR